MYTIDLLKNEILVHALSGILEVGRSTVIEVHDVNLHDVEDWAKRLSVKIHPLQIECHYHELTSERSYKHIELIRHRRDAVINGGTKLRGSVFVLGCGRFSKIEPRQDTEHHVDNYIVVDKDCAKVVKLLGVKGPGICISLSEVPVTTEPYFV